MIVSADKLQKNFQATSELIKNRLDSGEIKSMFCIMINDKNQAELLLYDPGVHINPTLLGYLEAWKVNYLLGNCGQPIEPEKPNG